MREVEGAMARTNYMSVDEYIAAQPEDVRALLYPVTKRVAAPLKKDLVPYDVSKGTIRFPLSRKVPVRLIQRITKLLAAEAAERASRRSSA